MVWILLEGIGVWLVTVSRFRGLDVAWTYLESVWIWPDGMVFWARTDHRLDPQLKIEPFSSNPYRGVS